VLLLYVTSTSGETTLATDPNKRGQTPTAEEEALQEPTIDPTMLLASILSGGLAGYNMGPSALKQDLPGLLQYIASKGMSPQQYMGRLPFVKEGLKSAAESGANFMGGVELNHMLGGGRHPMLENLAALPALPGAMLDLLPAEGAAQEGNAFAQMYPEIFKYIRGATPVMMVPSLLQKDGKKKK
jgi:hypothetical protein